MQHNSRYVPRTEGTAWDGLDGKVALITGAGRGQGRSHGVRLAEEGATIVAVDICERIASMKYSLASREDLNQTGKDVEALGSRVMARRATYAIVSTLSGSSQRGSVSSITLT